MWVYICIYIICKAYLSTKSNCPLIFREKTGSWQELSYHELPNNKYRQKETENLFISEHGREQRDGGTRYVLDEVYEPEYPSLEGSNIKTLIAQDVNSESGSQNGLQGVEVEDPTQEKQGTLATRERLGIWGEGRSNGRSPHKQAVCITIGT